MYRSGVRLYCQKQRKHTPHFAIGFHMECADCLVKSFGGRISEA